MGRLLFRMGHWIGEGGGKFYIMYIIFENNDKLLDSKNDSDRNSIYLNNCVINQ